MRAELAGKLRLWQEACDLCAGLVSEYPRRCIWMSDYTRVSLALFLRTAPDGFQHAILVGNRGNFETTAAHAGETGNIVRFDETFQSMIVLTFTCQKGTQDSLSVASAAETGADGERQVPGKSIRAIHLHLRDDRSGRIQSHPAGRAVAPNVG
ncbi:hypothetical protein MAMO4S_02850 [Mesorhizobium amorphae]